jgi:hypothetical protein
VPDPVSDDVVRNLLQWGVDPAFELPGERINGLAERFHEPSNQTRSSTLTTTTPLRRPRAHHV